MHGDKVHAVQSTWYDLQYTIDATPRLEFTNTASSVNTTVNVYTANSGREDRSAHNSAEHYHYSVTLVASMWYRSTGRDVRRGCHNFCRCPVWKVRFIICGNSVPVMRALFGGFIYVFDARSLESQTRGQTHTGNLPTTLMIWPNHL
jgi:hypothetical protein